MPDQAIIGKEKTIHVITEILLQGHELIVKSSTVTLPAGSQVTVNGPVKLKLEIGRLSEDRL